MIISGNNLTTWTSNPSYHFDPVNEIPATALGHLITISGGAGISAGTYTVGLHYPAFNVGAQGVHNLVVLYATANPYAAAPSASNAVGGSWAYEKTDTIAGSRGGNNFSLWSKNPQYGFDPDSPSVITGDASGHMLTILPGQSVPAANYRINNWSSAYDTGTQGSQNLIGFNSPASPDSSNPFGVAADNSRLVGIKWLLDGGAPVLTHAVYAWFTGAIKVLAIGDSITQNMTTQIATYLQTQYPNASSVAVSNQGHLGSTTADWLPGAPAGWLATAITAANAQGTTIASIMLGTNDAKSSVAASAATHKANVQAIVTALYAGIATLKRVVIHEQPYINYAVPAAATDWNAASNTLLRAYFGAYPTITGAWIGVSDAMSSFRFFEGYYGALSGDGVHPTYAGMEYILYAWLRGLFPAITGLPRPDQVAADVAYGPLTQTLIGTKVMVSGTKVWASGVWSPAAGAAVPTP